MSNIPSALLHANHRFATLIDILQEIHDPRINRGKRHPIVSSILIAICATIGGANSYLAIEQFGKDHLDWFAELIDIPNGIPSHDTLTRIFSLIDHRELAGWLLLWLSDCSNENDDCISIDAKTIKAQSFDHPLSILRAWSSRQCMVLAQTKVRSDSNEITAIPQLLRMLDLKGKIVTIDAIGTQKTIVRQIVDQGGEYVLPVKGNQHNFYNDLKLYLDDMIEGSFGNIFTYQETLDKGHGRLEKRRSWSTDNIEWLTQRKEWAKITSITVIESECYKKNEISIARRYFISSLPAEAHNILRIVRNHWNIENQLHWGLDVVFEEDRSTVRQGFGPQNIAIIKSVAFSLLKREPSNFGVKIKRSRANCNMPYLTKVLLNSEI